MSLPFKIALARKTALSFFAPALALTLGACNATAPKTPEEAAAQRVSTLNIYDDNTVSLRTRSSDKTAQHIPSQNNYVWTTDKTKILALQAGGQLYNVKDLRGVEPEDIGRATQYAALVKFSNGKEFVYPWKSLSWHVCDAAKVCSGPNVNAQGVVSSMQLADLEQPARIVNRYRVPADPRSAISKSAEAFPVLAPYKHTVVISSPEQAASDARQLAANLADYDKNAPKYIAASDTEKQRLEDAKQAQERQYQRAKEARIAAIRNEKVGVQTMCESGAVSGADSNRDRSVKCSRYGETSVAEMVELGWNIVGASTQQVVGDLGRPLFVHRLTMQKVK